jgi:hypothetical protein
MGRKRPAFEFRQTNLADILLVKGTEFFSARDGFLILSLRERRLSFRPIGKAMRRPLDSDHLGGRSVYSNRSEPERAGADVAFERHYSVHEIASMWGLSENTIRRMFCEEPGVIEWGREEKRFKRAYRTMRIPQSVVERVHRRLIRSSP